MAAGVTSRERSGKGTNRRGGRRARCPAAGLPDAGSGRVRPCAVADGAEAFASLRARLAVDLVPSDVAMPQLNGVGCSRHSPCPIPTYLYS